MSLAVLGTAHLFGSVDDARSLDVLRAAVPAGFTAFDTAPSYGHGRSEVEVGRLVATLDPRPRIVTKVGLAAEPPPGRATAALKAAARRLPAGVRQRLRPGGDAAPRGSFVPAEVVASVERSARRLGHVDRLMLHEVAADDVTDDLVEALTGLRERGVVAEVGVATINARAAAAWAAAPGLLTSAHVAVGPFAPRVDLPAGVARIGHGVFGAGGEDLSVLTARAAVRTRPRSGGARSRTARLGVTPRASPPRWWPGPRAWAAPN